MIKNNVFVFLLQFHVLQEIALRLERERRQEILDLVFRPRVTTEANNQEAPLLNVGAQPHHEQELQGDQINQAIVNHPPVSISFKELKFMVLFCSLRI